MYSVDKKIICKRLFDLKIFSLRKIAAIVDISHMTVKRWSVQNENELRNSKYHLIKRKQQKSGTHVVEALRALIQSNPTFLLEDLRIKIKDLFGFFISKSFLCSILHKKCNLSRKKVRFFGKSNDKEKIIESFLLKRQEYKAKNKFFISLDETSFSRKGKDIFGYSLKGNKIQIQRQWKRLTSNQLYPMLIKMDYYNMM